MTVDIPVDSNRGRPVPPDLDDRSWQTLVDQMRALIPVYAPQWTDQNPSDLGVSLIELFAWLAESVIYRLNRTPEKNYLAFLNLLGITRDPAAPAHTYLTFTGGAAPMLLLKGAQAQTVPQQGGKPVVFETNQDLTVLPANLQAMIAVGPFATGAATSSYNDLGPTLLEPPLSRYEMAIPPHQSVQLCWGLDRALVQPVGIGMRFYHPLGSSTATLSWTYAGPGTEPMTWPAIPTVADGTSGLRRDGSISVTVPGDWAAQRPSPQPGGAGGWGSVTPGNPLSTVTDELFWTALRITNPDDSPLIIGFDRILFNSVQAETALTTRTPEVLGTGTGQPFQVLPLAHRPLYRNALNSDPFGELVVEVGHGSPTVWAPWTAVDGYPSGAADVYRFDPVVGEITFGDFDGQHGAGSMPEAGTSIRANYRYVDSGAAGNVAAGSVTAFGTTSRGGTISGLTAVTNLAPGLDGADEEPIEDTLRRAPDQLKIRDRAVTADDYAFLAREASNDVRISCCLTPRLMTTAVPPAQIGDPWAFGGILRAPGTATVIIVPRPADVARPDPTPDQKRLVLAYLEQRRDLAVQLTVTGPRYLPVIVNVDIVLWQSAVDAGVDQTKLQQDTLTGIQTFLHPTLGGPSGAGWAVGQSVFAGDLFRAIVPSADVGFINSLLIKPDVPDYFVPPNVPDPTQRPIPLTALGGTVRVADYELVCAATDAQQKVSITVMAN